MSPMPVPNGDMGGSASMSHSTEAAVSNNSGSKKRSSDQVEDAVTIGESPAKTKQCKFYPHRQSEEEDGTEMNTKQKAFISASEMGYDKASQLYDSMREKENNTRTPVQYHSYIIKKQKAGEHCAPFWGGLSPRLMGSGPSTIPEKNKSEGLKMFLQKRLYGRNQNSCSSAPNILKKPSSPFTPKRPSLLNDTFSGGSRRSLGMPYCRNIFSQQQLHKNESIFSKKQSSQDENDVYKFEASPSKVPLDLKFSRSKKDDQCDTETSSSMRASSTSLSHQPLEAYKIGFRNLGNTCYMNSSVQSLLCLGPFCADVEDQQGMLSLHLPPLQALVRFARRGDEGRALGALKVVRSRFIEHIDASFQGDKQQDASEFLNKLLGQISEDIATTNRKYFKNLPEDTPNFIENNFEVVTIEKNTCKSCEKARQEKQKHLLLYLSLPSQTEEAVEALEGVPLSPGRPPCRPSVQGLLEEVLGTHRTKCFCCGEEEGARDTRLATLPRVLILQLKRYTNNLDKIMTPVKVSPYLEFDKFVVEDCVLPKPFSPRSKDVASQTERQAVAGSARNEARLSELERAKLLSKEQQDQEEQVYDAELQEAMRQSLLDTSEIENLSENDIRKIWVPPTNVRHLYRLVSVILHSGVSSGSGHYIAQTYRSDAKAWFSYSDLNVSEILPSIPLGLRSQKNCYLLFYMHRDIFEAMEGPTSTGRKVSPEANGVSSSS